MRISELEKALKRGIMMNPGRPALALLSANGAAIPSEFADSASTIASRSGRSGAKDSILRAAAEWV